jgi:hypothetical protein
MWEVIVATFGAELWVWADADTTKATTDETTKNSAVLRLRFTIFVTIGYFHFQLHCER